MFPVEATAPAVYGPAIKAHALYLMCAQHLPRERCALALADLFGVSVSTGTLDNWMREAADALVGFLAVVASELQAAPFVHADETSVRSGKAQLWVHVTCTALLTLLHVGGRNKKTIENGPLQDFSGTIVHDRLAMYFNYGGGHVLCNAHILRSLNELLGNHRHQAWARAFIDLIVDTKNHADAARAADKDQLSAYQRRKIRKRCNGLCATAATATPPPPPGVHLYRTNKDARLIALALATHRDLFPGEFPSPNGAARFATIRSYISTNRKNPHPSTRTPPPPLHPHRGMATHRPHLTGYR